MEFGAGKAEVALTTTILHSTHPAVLIGWTGGWMDGGWMDTWTGGWIDACMVGGWVDGWMDE